MALRPLFTARAPFNPGQGFQFSMPLLYTPPHRFLFLNPRRVNRTWGATRDHPFPVAVGSDDLEKPHCKRNGLEFDGDSFLKLFGGPLNWLHMNMPLLFTSTHEAIVFQSRHKKLAKPMNKLEIFITRIPTIPEDGLRLKAFFFKRPTPHLLARVVFSFPISTGVVHPKLERMIVFLMPRNPMNNPHTLD